MQGQSQSPGQYLPIFLLGRVHILYSESVLGRIGQASYRRYLGFQGRQIYQTVQMANRVESLLTVCMLMGQFDMMVLSCWFHALSGIDVRLPRFRRLGSQTSRTERRRPATSKVN